MTHSPTASRARPCTGSTLRMSDPQRGRPDFARIRGKVYLAIADQIEHAIVAGIFRAGDLLPTQRDVADDLGFHVNTINAAFREAARRGLIESRTRRGSVVSTMGHSG
ncbi:regulatory protein, gntR family [Paraburkholderia tropica]|uniref:Regulatory protein, gntR family n=2 Tax=Paraburkholderia tropica TaxID=92647 RepID=A0AAQ1GN35_9BURK|nr:GntR family transcriptional regulator [Paraburkholderia tropica]SEK13198.1 regulatory protein, gntR family [Paraburkholderia tropica]